MKVLALVLSFVAFSANAEVIITGVFGTDGASGEGEPLARSVQDAAAIYKALKVRPDSQGKKTIILADESQFECRKPFKGASRLDAACQLVLRASQKGKLVSGTGFSATVTFKGELATLIHVALPVDQSGRVGASSKSVANLSCVKPARPGLDATCTITDINAVSTSADI